jgi:hypothetical protein
VCQELEEAPQEKAWSLNSNFNYFLFLEHEIFEQHLKHLNLRTCDLSLNTKAWRHKKHKRKSQRSLNFFKLPQ